MCLGTLLALGSDGAVECALSALCCTALLSACRARAGCIGGGGQPRSADREALRKRQEALYVLDRGAALRRSQDNPAVQELYRSYLHPPLSPEAEALLHTSYQPGGPPKFDLSAAPPPPGAAPHGPRPAPEVGGLGAAARHSPGPPCE